MKIAAITMVFNERVFLPIWLNYYGPKLGYENLFVIDDGSNDGSTSDSRIINLIEKTRSSLDEEDRAKLVSCFHEELLGFYDLVIYTDADELIVVDPSLGVSLKEYLSADDRQYKTLIGLNVLHRHEREAEIDFDKPLFEQRHFVQFAVGHCKPLISKIPIRWGAGFHWSQFEPQYDLNLFLFHLRAMDLGVSKEKIKTLNALQFSTNALAKRHSFHFRMTEQEYLKLLFPNEIDFENAQQNMEFINPVIRGGAVEECLARVPERFSKAIELSRYSKANDLSGAPSKYTSKGEEGLKEETIKTLFANSMNRMILETPDRGRNELCPCGSYKKWKHCHGSPV